MPDNERSVTDDDMRIVYTGAADVIQEYALSKSFNWKRDRDILRPIAQSAEKLMAILDAEKEVINQ